MSRAAWLAGAIAILPAMASAAPVPTEASAGRFMPPEIPMVLTRTLRRPLPGGQEVITLRSYLLRFTREAERIRIDGDLLAVTVEAPPALQTLAELERGRPDTGMFPMWLDAQGMLLPGGGGAAGPERQAAVEQVAARIGTLGLPAEDSAQAQAFVGQFRDLPGRTPWPRDLFRPAPGAHSDYRMIPMPNGRRGNVTVDTQAALADGQLASFTRKTTTDLDGNTRVTIEEWAMVKASK